MLDGTVTRDQEFCGAFVSVICPSRVGMSSLYTFEGPCVAGRKSKLTSPHIHPLRWKLPRGLGSGCFVDMSAGRGGRAVDSPPCHSQPRDAQKSPSSRPAFLTGPREHGVHPSYRPPGHDAKICEMILRKILGKPERAIFFNFY